MVSLHWCVRDVCYFFSTNRKSLRGASQLINVFFLDKISSLQLHFNQRKCYYFWSLHGTSSPTSEATSYDDAREIKPNG
jgi:hypothetical protein